MQMVLLSWSILDFETSFIRSDRMLWMWCPRAWLNVLEHSFWMKTHSKKEKSFCYLWWVSTLQQKTQTKKQIWKLNSRNYTKKFEKKPN